MKMWKINKRTDKFISYIRVGPMLIPIIKLIRVLTLLER